MRQVIMRKLEEVTMSLGDIARCCYYAKSFGPNHHIEAQLDRILDILGIHDPTEVGLSKNVVKRGEKK